MKIRFFIVASLLVTLITPVSAIAADPKPGTACKGIGLTSTYSGKKYTCIKSGKKFVWNKGVKSIASPIPTPTPTATSTPTPVATPTKDILLECKLPIADGRGDVAIGGFPRLADRLRTIGTVVTAVVMVDFSDAPASMTPQEAFSKISGATDTFNEVSYGKLNYSFVPNLKWYRMSKPSTYYAPLNKSFNSHREYIVEALTIADPETDFSKVDNFIILANPDAKGLGFSGPAFASIRGNGVTFDGKYLANGATSAADLLGWGSIWLNHEVTHTMGMVDIYSFREDANSPMKGGFRFTGDFSYMGLSSFTSTAPGLFAWERWVLGWINDSQIECMNGNSLTQIITSVESIGGLKAVVVPINQTKVVVIESRRAIGLDRKLSKVGALVYVVDSSIQSGAGPVQIYPQNAADQKYLSAPRVVGESVTVEGITITVIQSDANTDTVKIQR